MSIANSTQKSWHQLGNVVIGSSQLVLAITVTVLYILAANNHFSPVQLQTINVVHHGIAALITFAALLHTRDTTSKCQKAILVIHFLICLTFFVVLNRNDISIPPASSPGNYVYLWGFTIYLAKILAEDAAKKF